MTSLKIENVTKIYPTLRRALEDVTVDIGTGVYGLLGPNGAGKSTLMSILAAELDFESGNVTLDGIDVRRHGTAWRKSLGLMPQSFDFVPHVTGIEYLEQCAHLSGHSPRKLRPRINELLQKVNLAQAASRYAANYSRGMKQRLGVAGALLCNPRLVLLDEPTSGLDPQERVFFRELLATIARDCIVILSTHIVADVERCCGRIGVLADGKLFYDGPPEQLVRRVDGRVWEVEAPRRDLDQWLQSRRIVSLREESGRAIARLVSDTPPFPGARSATPTLEDAYMYLVESAGAKLQEAGT